MYLLRENNSFIALLCYMACTLCLLSSCATTKITNTEDSNPKELYEQLQALEGSSSYLQAQKILKLMEEKFPFSTYTQQANLDEIYLRFNLAEYEKVAHVAERFIWRYPKHQRLDYVHYMLALAYFYKNQSNLHYFFRMKRANRDTTALSDSYEYFKQLIHKFPKSIYTPDAKQRIIYIRSVKAQTELNAIQFYYNKKAWIAVANRSIYLIKHYPDTQEASQAINYLTEATQALGTIDMQREAEIILNNHAASVAH